MADRLFFAPCSSNVFDLPLNARLPSTWYECLHVGVSGWDLPATADATRALAAAQDSSSSSSSFAEACAAATLTAETGGRESGGSGGSWEDERKHAEAQCARLAKANTAANAALASAFGAPPSVASLFTEASEMESPSSSASFSSSFSSSSSTSSMESAFWPAPSEVLPWYAAHNGSIGFALEGLTLRFCPSVRSSVSIYKNENDEFEMR